MKVQDLVEQEVGKRWAEFAAKHPGLAEELTRDDYTVAAMDRLRSEPEYRQAVANGQMLATAAETIVSWVEKAVAIVMRI